MIQVKTFTATDTSDREKEVVLEVDQQVNLFLRENKIQRNELISLMPTPHHWSVGNTAYFTHTIVLTIEVAPTPELQVMAGTEQPYGVRTITMPDNGMDLSVFGPPDDDKETPQQKQARRAMENAKEAAKYWQ